MVESHLLGSIARCSVCLNSFVNKSYLAPCYHSYCFICIRRWFQIQSKTGELCCPLCKCTPLHLVYNFNIQTGLLKKCDMDQLLRARPGIDISPRSYLQHFNQLSTKSWVDRSAIYQFHWVPLLTENLLSKLDIWLPQFNPNTGKDEYLELVETIPSLKQLIVPVSPSSLKEWILREICGIFYLLKADFYLKSIDENRLELDVVIQETIMDIIFNNFSYLALRGYLYNWLKQYTVQFIYELACFIMSGYGKFKFDLLIKYSQCHG